MKVPGCPFHITAPSQKTIDSFSHIPWCAALFNDPSLKPFTPESRQPQTTSESSFFSRTLNTPDTIEEFQCFFRPSSSPDTDGDILGILIVGGGMNGHADTSHGGFIGLLLDEVLGYAVRCGRISGKTTMTAYLNIQYKKPIRTPTVLLVKSRLTRREGKKLFGQASLEDGNGTVYATAEALFILVELAGSRNEKLKL